MAICHPIFLLSHTAHHHDLRLTVSFAIMSLPRFVGTDFGSAYEPDGTFDLSFADSAPWKRDARFAIDMGIAATPFA